MTSFQISHAKIVLKESESLKISKTLRNSLDRFEYAIREALAILSDENGPKGGLDKKCKLRLRLAPRGLAFVSGTGATFIEAASNACEKVAEVVNRKIGKRRAGLRRKWQGDPVSLSADRADQFNNLN